MGSEYVHIYTLASMRAVVARLKKNGYKIECVHCGIPFNEDDGIVSKRKSMPSLSHQTRRLYCMDCAKKLNII